MCECVRSFLNLSKCLLLTMELTTVVMFFGVAFLQFVLSAPTPAIRIPMFEVLIPRLSFLAALNAFITMHAVPSSGCSWKR